MCYGLTWTFCIDEEVFSFACREALFCFRNVTMAVDIGLRSRDSREDTWNLFAILEALECCFVAVDEICCREMLVGSTAEVKVRDPCTITIKLQKVAKMSQHVCPPLTYYTVSRKK